MTIRSARCLPLAVLLAGACATPQPFQDPFAPMQAAKTEGAGAPEKASGFLRSEVDTPSYRLKSNENDFALVIGIQDYAALPAAEFAERDAAAVRSHLLALGYPERNLIMLTGKGAGRASIDKYLDSWLPRNLDENSRLFVYFSGHGSPDVKSGRAYLVPWDGDPQYLDTTSYPLKEFYRKLDALKAKTVIVAMDACFTGSGGRSVIAKGMRPLVTKTDAGAAGSSRLVVLSASAGDEVTGTEDAEGHGLFTYYFLKALNERKGEATIRQLFDALTPGVKDAARRQNRDQTPQLAPGDQARFARLRLDD